MPEDDDRFFCSGFGFPEPWFEDTQVEEEEEEDRSMEGGVENLHGYDGRNRGFNGSCGWL